MKKHHAEFCFNAGLFIGSVCAGMLLLEGIVSAVWDMRAGPALMSKTQAMAVAFTALAGGTLSIISFLAYPSGDASEERVVSSGPGPIVPPGIPVEHRDHHHAA